MTDIEIAINVTLKPITKIAEKFGITEEDIELYGKYKINIQERYKITDEEIKNIEEKDNSIYELMSLIGRKRGALVSGGNIDDEKTARIILDDFRNCKLGKISLEEP